MGELIPFPNRPDRPERLGQLVLFTVTEIPRPQVENTGHDDFADDLGLGRSSLFEADIIQFPTKNHLPDDAA